MKETSKCRSDATRLGVWPARENPLTDKHSAWREVVSGPLQTGDRPVTFD